MQAAFLNHDGRRGMNALSSLFQLAIGSCVTTLHRFLDEFGVTLLNELAVGTDGEDDGGDDANPEDAPVDGRVGVAGVLWPGEP